MRGQPLAQRRFSLDDPPQLRAALRRELPREAFEPQPWRGFVGLGEVVLIVAIVWGLKSILLHWAARLFLALVLGQLFTSVALVLGHEGLHGAVFRSKPWIKIGAALGTAPLLVTPGSWRAWHVQAHHANTNRPGYDPECMPTLAEYHASAMRRFIHSIVPGSRHVFSFVGLFVLFTTQAQLFLWYYVDQPGYAHIRINRLRERMLTMVLALAWMALGVWLGAAVSLYAIVIPMLFMNFTLLCYIMTNHWLSPATPDRNNPFVNTVSVTVHPIVDWLHFNFSYHQEHHIFPQMSGRYLPALRAALRRLNPAASAVYPLGRALRAVYGTPALYADEHTLVAPDGQRATRIATIRSTLN
jgi:fatty acid desaturase